jgi:DNA-directed RNA polymerase specialized sigma24 family protein
MPELSDDLHRIRATLVTPYDTSVAQEWRFDGDATVVIGRGKDADIRLQHARVSRVHATLSFDGTAWQCSCPGQNGTYLNGEIVPAIEVTEGLSLEFTAGGPTLQFSIGETPDEETASSLAGDVTIWMGQLAEGDGEAAANLYEHYFEQIANLARRRMSPAYRRVADEEDVALSVLQNLFEGITNGRYPELSSRENLWRLLVVMTARKAINIVEKQRAQKRGGGAVRGESILQGPDAGMTPGFDRFEGQSATPDFVVELEEESKRQFARLGDETLKQVAILKMEGYTNDEIAAKLETTTRTVERKLQRIREIWSDEV